MTDINDYLDKLYTEGIDVHLDYENYQMIVRRFVDDCISRYRLFKQFCRTECNSESCPLCKLANSLNITVKEGSWKCKFNKIIELMDDEE